MRLASAEKAKESIRSSSLSRLIKRGVRVTESRTANPPAKGSSKATPAYLRGSKTAMRRPSEEKPAVPSRGSVASGSRGLAAEAGASRSQRESASMGRVGDGEAGGLLRGSNGGRR